MADISLAPGSLTYRENGDAIALDANAMLSNFDGLGDLGGYVLELSLTGAIESDRLIVSETSSIQLDGRRVLLSEQQIATFTQAYDLAGPLLTLTLSSGTTASQLESLIRSLAYVNVSDALVDGNRTVNLALKSGQGQEEVAAERALQVTADEDSPQVLTSQLLFDGEVETLVSISPENQAAPAGDWLYALDLTEVPYDIPIYSFFGQEINLRGTPIEGNTAYSFIDGVVGLTTDDAAYAGFSNYQFDYSAVSIGGVIATRDVPIGLTPRNSNFPNLDRNAGYEVGFDLKLQSESRIDGADKNGDSIDDRAGFSIIVVGNDQHGIELGFWQDRIWAQNDGTSQVDSSIEPDDGNGDPTRTFFTQGESADFAFDPNQFVSFDLIVKGETYNLLADGVSLLTGSLRDYSAFDPPSQTIDNVPVIGTANALPPDPYEQPNFLFFGDNTPTAKASVQLDNITVETAPARDELTVSTAVFPQLNVQDLDLDEGRSQLTLSVQNGILTIGDPINGGVSSEDISGSGTNQLVLTGTREQLNTTLDAGLLSYSGNGSETLSVEVIPEPDTPVSLLGEISLYNRESVTQIKDGVISTEPLRPFIRDQNWQLQTSGNFSGGDAEDLIWHNVRTGQVVLWNDVNTSATALPSVTDTGWQVAGNGLFNDDSTSDLLWYNRETQEVSVWYMNNGEVGDRISLSLSNPASTALQGYELQGSGDFDGDGNIDLLWVEGYGVVDLLPSLPTPRVKLSSIINGEITDVVDVDAPQALGTRLEWQTYLARDPNLPAISGRPLAFAQGIGDYNGDGKEDLIIGSGTTAISLWLMNGVSAPQVVSLS